MLFEWRASWKSWTESGLGVVAFCDVAAAVSTIFATSPTSPTGPKRDIILPNTFLHSYSCQHHLLTPRYVACDHSSSDGASGVVRAGSSRSRRNSQRRGLLRRQRSVAFRAGSGSGSAVATACSAQGCFATGAEQEMGLPSPRLHHYRFTPCSRFSISLLSLTHLHSLLAQSLTHSLLFASLTPQVL